MASVARAKVIWDHEEIKTPIDRHFNKLYVNPSDEYPFGRKGFVFTNFWKQLNNGPVKPDGLLILDADVVIDPEDFTEMLSAIDADPKAVHVAPAKIFPKSTKRPRWTWAHWTIEASQALEDQALWFSFNFTYLPKGLINSCIADGMKNWTYPNVDMNVSRTAQKTGVKVNIVKNCTPKHANY